MTKHPDCICHSGKRVPACPVDGDAKARKASKPTRIRKQTPRRQRPVRTQSDKQQRRQDALNGIKMERLAQQAWRGRPLGASGSTYFCEGGCGRGTGDFNEAWASLHLHHEDELRSKGNGYRGGSDFGVDHPEKLELLCLECHRSRHAKPEFSATEDVSA